MALRTVRLIGDEILTKPCREVNEMTPRLEELVEDMLETMYEAEGIGLAAPQVGVLRRIVVIDIWQPGVEDDEAEDRQLGEGGDAPTGTETATEAPAGDAPAEEADTAAQETPGETATTPARDDAPTETEVDEGEEVEEGPLIMVNPVITRKEGEQTGDEGCLSLPGKVGTVTRPNEITVKYLDENMEEYELEAEGLLARAICHEVDHLEGHTYVEFVEGEIREAGHSAEEEGEDEESPEAESAPAENVADRAAEAPSETKATGTADQPAETEAAEEPAETGEGS